MSNITFDIFNKEIAFGLTPFETIYFENRKPQFLYEHYRRLKRTCSTFKIDFNYDYIAFEMNVLNYLSSSEPSAGALKIAYCNGEILFNTRNPSYSRESYKAGFKLKVSKTVRDEKNILNFFKTFNYGINYIEDLRAKEKGYDSCLFLNTKHDVCETAYANIFFRRGKTLYTPRLSSGILNGIMRDKVIDFARANELNVIKLSIGISSIDSFEECFITNSISGVMPIASIGDIAFEDRWFAGTVNIQEDFKREWNR